MLRWRAARVTSRPCCAMRKETLPTPASHPSSPKAGLPGTRAGARIAGDPRGAASKQHAGRGLVGVIFPSAVLVLLPKCPVCIAAYVAMGTGIGLSFAAATYLHTAVIILCALMVSYFAAGLVRRVIARLSSSDLIAQRRSSHRHVPPAIPSPMSHFLKLPL
jgi:hypothetical protein